VTIPVSGMGEVGAPDFLGRASGPPAERGQYLQYIVLLFYVKVGMGGRIPPPLLRRRRLTEAGHLVRKYYWVSRLTEYVGGHSCDVGFTTRARRARFRHRVAPALDDAGPSMFRNIRRSPRTSKARTFAPIGQPSHPLLDAAFHSGDR
jgi:hypothetical protein